MNLKRPINVFATELPATEAKIPLVPEVLEESNPNSTSSFPGSDNAKEGMIYIGEGIEYSGSILKAQTVVIRGKGEGEIKTENLEVQSNGNFKGKVKANDVTIAGQVEGELVVSGSLTIRSSGRVEGKISYEKIAIEDGGELVGHIALGTKDMSLLTDLKKSMNTC